jgi:hypothetical protein
MHPIEIAHTLAQREAHARVEHRRGESAPVQDPYKIVPLAGVIPTSALASALLRAGPVPMSSVTPPEMTAIKKRRWRSAWARAVQTHRSPIGNV